MRADEVPAELVEAAARAMWSIPPQDPDSALAWPSWDVAVERAEAGLWDVPQMVADARNLARHALAAVLPEYGATVLRDAADEWQTREWANVPRHADRVADRLGAAQHVCDWLRTRAARQTATTEGPTT